MTTLQTKKKERVKGLWPGQTRQPGGQEAQLRRRDRRGTGFVGEKSPEEAEMVSTG